MIADVGAGERAAKMCGDGVDVIELPIDDSWFRDSGPIYVTDGDRRVALDWAFNAWGRKFTPFADDDAVARRYAESVGDEVRTIPVVLEGGAIAVDGVGTLVTTEQCLLHPNRNPALTRVDIEAVLRAELGVTTIVWLPHGLALDHDTDGHVDNVAAFARPGTLARAGLQRRVRGRLAARQCQHALRPWGASTRSASRSTSSRSRCCRSPRSVASGWPCRISTTTSATASSPSRCAVIPPTTTCSRSSPSSTTDREVVGLDVGAVLAYGGGGIHCITQQVPRRLTPPPIWGRSVSFDVLGKFRVRP